MFTGRRAGRANTVPAAGALAAAAVAAAAVPAAFSTAATAARAGESAVPDVRVAQQLPRARPLVTRVAAASSGKSYTVAAGDTLSGIAGKACGDAGKWPGIWHQNQAEVPDPDLILPGQKLRFTCDGAALQAPASAPASPASAPASPPAASGKTYGVSYGYPNHHGDGDGDGWDVAGPAPVSTPAQPAAQMPVAAVTGVSGGILSCAGLESLWEQAGGSAGEAVMAASIAMAESGGNPNAISPTDDWGLWQINKPSWGALAALNSLVNARAAVQISADGRDWSAWVTWQTGAYKNKC